MDGFLYVLAYMDFTVLNNVHWIVLCDGNVLKVINSKFCMKLSPVLHPVLPVYVKELLSLDVSHHQSGIQISISTSVTQYCLVYQL